EVDVHTDPLGAGEGERDRRRARPGRDARVGETVPPELTDECARARERDVALGHEATSAIHRPSASSAPNTTWSRAVPTRTGTSSRPAARATRSNGWIATAAAASERRDQGGSPIPPSSA